MRHDRLSLRVARAGSDARHAVPLLKCDICRLLRNAALFLCSRVIKDFMIQGGDFLKVRDAIVREPSRECSVRQHAPPLSHEWSDSLNCGRHR
jgi:hypothetical protein